jgi:hypothetical protein
MPSAQKRTVLNRTYDSLPHFANGTNREIIEEIDKEIIRCIHFVLVSALYSPFRRVLKCRQLKNVPSLTGLTIRFLTSQMEQTGK